MPNHPPAIHSILAFQDRHGKWCLRFDGELTHHHSPRGVADHVQARLEEHEKDPHTYAIGTYSPENGATVYVTSPVKLCGAELDSKVSELLLLGARRQLENAFFVRNLGDAFSGIEDEDYPKVGLTRVSPDATSFVHDWRSPTAFRNYGGASTDDAVRKLTEAGIPWGMEDSGAVYLSTLKVGDRFRRAGEDEIFTVSEIREDDFLCVSEAGGEPVTWGDGTCLPVMPLPLDPVAVARESHAEVAGRALAERLLARATSVGKDYHRRKTDTSMLRSLYESALSAVYHEMSLRLPSAPRRSPAGDDFLISAVISAHGDVSLTLLVQDAWLARLNAWDRSILVAAIRYLNH